MLRLFQAHGIGQKVFRWVDYWNASCCWASRMQIGVVFPKDSAVCTRSTTAEGMDADDVLDTNHAQLVG